MIKNGEIGRILIGGSWEESVAAGTFQARNPSTGQLLPSLFPVSSATDCDRMLGAAQEACCSLRETSEDRIAGFLEGYAAAIDSEADSITAIAHLESGYPVSPRLKDVELPRTTSQLRQAADAARDGSWRMPTIDSAANIRSYLAPIGPVCVIGPSNFPLAFGSVSGGDFAAAIAAGNPVIAKAHPLHPGTATRLAELAADAARDAGLPAGTVQLFYQISPEDGEHLVSDPRMAATAFTGSRASGLRLKRAAEQAGNLIYLELSSINPVVVMPGALAERSEAIAEEFCNSALMGGGQFCTNPGLLVLIAGEVTQAFLSQVAKQYQNKPAGRLMSAGIVASLGESIGTLRNAGAQLISEGAACDDVGFHHPNTLLQISGEKFLSNPAAFQTEAFGNASLVVVANDVEQAATVLKSLEGNLTGCIYSAQSGVDDRDYWILAKALRPRVGRLLNDKMPTGVAVSPAMNHGGPYPATGHPHFTAVGMPASIRRFTMLQCFDGVRHDRLPPLLQDKNPGCAWRLIDGGWSQGNVAPKKE